MNAGCEYSILRLLASRRGQYSGRRRFSSVCVRSEFEAVREVLLGSSNCLCGNATTFELSLLSSLKVPDFRKSQIANEREKLDV